MTSRKCCYGYKVTRNTPTPKTYTCQNSTKGMYCCVAVVTLVRRTRQDVTIEVLDYLVVSAVVLNATLIFRNRNFCLRTHAHACRSVWDCVWNVMAHAQKPYFVFRRKGRIHLNRQGRQFSRLLAAEVCASAVVMLDTPCSEVVWRVLATYSIRQFPLHFPSRASPYAITFQLDSTSEAYGIRYIELTASGRGSWESLHMPIYLCF